uniref:Flocculation protein FLO11 isoform X2 n=1 Tax=Nicotiana sylvestris TaxID=4096 RepID=A0A1U7WXV1_NICSY|nr:PREDICTED: flocculation protein FLO11 isoform X2 [Nicotiana sylvestris]
MSFQELQDLSTPIDSPLSMLHLSSTADPTTEQQLAGDPSPEKTTLYGGSTTKTTRYSNCNYTSSLEEPFPKRTATDTTPLPPPPISTSAGDTNNHYHILEGFTKLPLPNYNYQESNSTFLKPQLIGNSRTPSPSPSPAKPPLVPAQFPTPLYRTLSDPTGFSGSGSNKRKSATTQSPLARTTSWSPNTIQELGGGAFSKNGESPNALKSTTPPTQCALSRTASWSPKNVQEFGESLNAMRKSPTQSALARTGSLSQNVQESSGVVNNAESPATMRLKRMKQGMKEMRQWFDLMIQEDAQVEKASSEENKSLKENETETETETEASCEEAVWVERMGNSLVLHFRCPCGDGYQILLSGNNCYYKLLTF